MWSLWNVSILQETFPEKPERGTIFEISIFSSGYNIWDIPERRKIAEDKKFAWNMSHVGEKKNEILLTRWKSQFKNLFTSFLHLCPQDVGEREHRTPFATFIWQHEDHEIELIFSWANFSSTQLARELIFFRRNSNASWRIRTMLISQSLSFSWSGIHFGYRERNLTHEPLLCNVLCPIPMAWDT